MFIEKGTRGRVSYIAKRYAKANNEYMSDVYENIGLCNPNRQRKVLIIFDDMIADIVTKKKFQSIIKVLFIRCRKINISLYLLLSLIFLYQRT